MKLFSLASLALLVAAATPAVAGVNVDINLGAPVVVQAAPPPPPVPVYAEPPEIVVAEAPRFIYTPAIGFHVAIGTPYDLVYTGKDYLYNHGGRWYRGRTYYGPWVACKTRNIPSVLRRQSIGQIRHYRDQEYRQYRHDRAHNTGRFFRPEYRSYKRHGGDHRETHRRDQHARH
ncbi:hypothetical protein [Pelobacter propionicus]|uniref:Uncharacterized protein n=1 Tax=Pelobacter propionicus (strain DSM 2379 / NBRC 103807 / OttBd1) TaxID=338966 RepID=A1APU4_PELPD|nr:hypothetical protein [Pelobacter propionicus]ABK99364.1 conserved hypothetical protein [Pelobacter propionicus DSM 2379]